MKYFVNKVLNLSFSAETTSLSFHLIAAGVHDFMVMIKQFRILIIFYS